MATEYATLVFKADTRELGQAYNAMKKLHQQGKITDKTLESFEAQMKGVRSATNQTNTALTGASKGAKQLQTSMGGAGRGAGQAGVQVQQFVGQVQAGTNPMLAFSQQAADLGIVLGAPMLGVIAALGASLGMVLLPQLFKGSRALNEFDEVAKELDISLRTDAPALYAARMKELEKAEREAREEIQESELALIKKQKFLEMQKGFYDANTISAERLAFFTKAYNKEEEELLVTLDRQRIALKEAMTATREFATAKTEAEIAAEDQAEAIRQLVLDLTLQEQKLAMNETAFAVYTAQLKGADAAVTDFIRTTMMSIEALKEQEKASQAADRFLEKIEKQARSIGRTKAEVISLEMATHKLSQSERERVAQIIKQIDLEEKRAETVKESEAFIRQLVQEGLIVDEKRLGESYARRNAQLKDALDRNLITESQYIEAKASLEEEGSKRAIQATGDALTAIGQFSKDAFYAAKAFSIAQAIINTYEGATKALAAYPPPFNYIAAAATVAAGLAQVQQIRSQQPPSSARALGGQVRGGESYVVGERGPEVLTMGTNGRIIPNDKLGGSQQVVNRNINVSFQISTVDARGFDSLLQSRRGQIIGMINSAMNDRGTRGIV